MLSSKSNNTLHSLTTTNLAGSNFDPGDGGDGGCISARSHLPHPLHPESTTSTATGLFAPKFYEKELEDFLFKTQEPSLSGRKPAPHMHGTSRSGSKKSRTLKTVLSTGTLRSKREAKPPPELGGTQRQLALHHTKTGS